MIPAVEYSFKRHGLFITNTWILLMVNLILSMKEAKARAFMQQQTVKRASQKDVEILYNHFTKSSLAKVSHYGAYPIGTSACSLDPIPPLIGTKKWTLAAVSKADFLGSLACGTCWKVSLIDLVAREDPDDIYVAVIDKCNDCQKGEISLYTEGSQAMKANIVAVDCMDQVSSKEELKMVIEKAENNETKIQIRNSLLPVISLECFQDGRWICLQRETDNYFTFADLQPTAPAQFRVRSIAGETIGFSLDKFVFGKDVQLKHQFTTFHAATRAGAGPATACHYEAEMTHSSSRGPLVQRGKSVQPVSGLEVASKDPLKLSEEVSKNQSHANGGSAKTDLSMQQVSNESFCHQRQDGSYQNESNCERFILCFQGKALDKECPNGLRYNTREGVCDWPKNVICNASSARSRSVSLEGNVMSDDNDEDVYTKRFIGKKKKQKDSKRPLRDSD